MHTSVVRLTAALALLIGGLGARPAQAKRPPRIELKEGWYFLEGRKTLINALGYESGARPGEVPYETATRNLDQVRRDLKLIKAAGFNGIRTWSQMSEEELKVVQASGLKVIFGIWLKPDEDFSDPAVIAKDLELIRRVLAYSRKYDCVITYLIMNEPMPEHIRKVGAQATRDLWQRAVELIHQLHPGVPVTISGNSVITEWIDMNLFDVYARNTYDYKEGSNFTHGYANAQKALTASYGQGKPTLLTEFGRSVSRRGGDYYGGNTLQEQADAMVKYYRDILDSGATGLCPFYFADGWWKSGAPTIHNDEAEEWFGFFGFKDGKDTLGHPRPAWHALQRYNTSLVSSPRNQEFYLNEIPVEAFCQPEVRKLRVVHQDVVLLDLVPDAHGYCSSRLTFAGAPLTDRELVFESLDAKGRLLKVETLQVLTGKEAIQWPTLEIRTPVQHLEPGASIPVEFVVRSCNGFTLGNELRYAFSPHKGWERPEARSRKLDPNPPVQTLTDGYRVPHECPVLTLYAGFDLRFGKFTRTIYAHRYLYPDAWADPLRAK